MNLHGSSRPASPQSEMPPPADLEFQGHVHLACAVLNSAVKDFFCQDENRVKVAEGFLFGDSLPHVSLRTHWFTQAGLVVPKESRLRRMMDDGKKRRLDRAVAREEAEKRGEKRRHREVLRTGKKKP